MLDLPVGTAKTRIRDGLDPSPRHDGGGTVNESTCTRCPAPTPSTPSTTTSAPMFEEHLPGCLDCQAEVASLREAAALMADDAALTPPASLRASVLAGISHRPSAAPGDRPRPSPPERRAIAKVVPMRRRRLPDGVAGCGGRRRGCRRWSSPCQPWQDDDEPPRSAPRPGAGRRRRHSTCQVDFNDGSNATVFRSQEQGQGRAGHREDGGPAGRQGLRAVAARPRRATCSGRPDAKAARQQAAARGRRRQGHRGRHHRRARRRLEGSPPREPIALFDLGKADA